ncbi:EAL domain-containing protein [Luteibacter jiangsuensis]|uniref:EAL domain-containing protein n=1 Tax=Luteibacter jiangsuensis TaxID=637577 RepID=A0ABX0Q4P1_9GAMM|nr:EAL domain-containing protein [Luteibacter jiangsuensis]NID04697.1 EAL domain-containing protein [Luteibacter jiangsuensis]
MSTDHPFELSGTPIAYFQPQQRLDGTVDGAEALARWERPNGDLLTPDQFLPRVGRERGAATLTRRMCVRALALIAWQTAVGRPLNVSVNAPPDVIADPGFVAWLTHELAGTAGDGSLTLELLETPYHGSERRLVRALERLREAGVRIAIDDFGTQASTMRRVRRLPIDEWKIARELVHGVSQCGTRARRLARLMHVGQRLGLRTVLEGVEAPDDLAWAHACCPANTVIQGFAVARPMSFSDTRRWIAGRRIH